MSPRRPPAVHPDPLTPEERAWAERLALIGPHAGPHGGPPPAVDTKILAAAHAAVAQRAPRRSQRRRWPTLLGAAASLVIVVGLAWQLQPLLRTRPSLSEGPVVAAPVRSSEGALSADVLAAADPVARRAVNNPPPPTMPSQVRTPRRSVAPATPSIARMPVTRAPPPRATAPAFGDDAIPPYADYAGAAAARQAASQNAASKTAAAREATGEQRGRAAVVSPQAFPPAPADATGVTVMPEPPASATTAAARVDAQPPASAQKAVPSPAQAAQPQKYSPTLDRIQVSGSRIGVADLPVGDDTRLEPAAWLQRIRDRRDAGDLDDARESLVLFRKRHPRIRLPADLAQLAR